MSVQLILSTLSGLSFIAYGVLCIFTGHMRSEFKRYNLESFRILTGILEILGGVGSLLRPLNDTIYSLACLGLFLLMFMGIIVRIKLKDPLIKIMPALILMVTNFYLIYLQFN
jgi:hypothetical protein